MFEKILNIISKKNEHKLSNLPSANMPDAQIQTVFGYGVCDFSSQVNFSESKHNAKWYRYRVKGTPHNIRNKFIPRQGTYAKNSVSAYTPKVNTRSVMTQTGVKIQIANKVIFKKKRNKKRKNEKTTTSTVDIHEPYVPEPRGTAMQSKVMYVPTPLTKNDASVASALIHEVPPPPYPMGNICMATPIHTKDASIASKSMHDVRPPPAYQPPPPPYPASSATPLTQNNASVASTSVYEIPPPPPYRPPPPPYPEGKPKIKQVEKVNLQFKKIKEKTANNEMPNARSFYEDFLTSVYPSDDEEKSALNLSDSYFKYIEADFEKVYAEL